MPVCRATWNSRRTNFIIIAHNTTFSLFVLAAAPPTGINVAVLKSQTVRNVADVPCTLGSLMTGELSAAKPLQFVFSWLS